MARKITATKIKKRSRSNTKAKTAIRRRSSPRAKKVTARKPLTIRKVTLPVAALRSLTAEQRSAILLLGLFVNEANWLRKLLVAATVSIGDDPEGQANFALTVQLATTLAAKIHEGWNKVRASDLAKTINTVGLPKELAALRKSINLALATPTIKTIRNSYSFHYPAALDFGKLTSIDDADAVLYVTDKAFNGDVFSLLSTIVALEPLLAIDAAEDWRVALEGVWNEVTNVAGLYCFFLAEILALLISEWLSGKIELATIFQSHAPDASDLALHFFVHPPSNLEELRASERP